jgi:predicted N-formylglutamate amidohydrolase
VKRSIIISCEHGGNSVPEKYKALFTGAEDVLNSHRGWDPGALEVATYLVKQLVVPLVSMTTTRLLVEMNRSPDSEELFSEYSQGLSAPEKQQILEEFYLPYRLEVENQFLALPKPILHLSVHSFTPVFNDVIRKVDIGLLFDPFREEEVKVCAVWKEALTLALPSLTIEFNEPYKGTDDGLTTGLKKKFPGSEYLGIELEINQKYVDTPQMALIQSALADVLRTSRG